MSRIYIIILERVKIRDYYHHQDVIMMGSNKIVRSLQINKIKGNEVDPERTSFPLHRKEPLLCWRERQAHAVVVALSSSSSRKSLQKWQSATKTKGKIQLPADTVTTGMPASWSQITVFKIEIILKWHQILRHHLCPQRNPVKSRSTELTPINQRRWRRRALCHRQRSKLRRSECFSCISRGSPWANPALQVAAMSRQAKYQWS